MTPERYEHLAQIFRASLELETDKRDSFLDQACSGDERLRQEVQALLDSHEKSGMIIDKPALEIAAKILANDKTRFAPGSIISHYQVISLIGVGGMGEVYLATDTKLARKVALKTLPKEFTAEPDRMRRFEQEAKAASALNHPNIITIYETGAVDGVHFISSEFIKGQTLREWMTGTQIKPCEIVDVAIQIASALVEAHAEGIIHRDIKPENVMMRSDGLVKILDFGLAKLAEHRTNMANSGEPANFIGRTEPGVVMGTYTYMSPEQVRGLEVDARTDIFSLGVVLYEMVAGTIPFPGETKADVITAILGKEPLPLKRFTCDVPESLESIVTKTLVKDREERYQTAKELLTDLRRLKQRLDFKAEQEHSTKSQDHVDQEGEFVKKPFEITNKRLIPRIISAARINIHEKTIVLGLLCLTGLLVTFFIVFWFMSTGASTTETASVQSLTHLTTWSGLTLFPSISQDGSRVAYSSDHNGKFEIYVRQFTTGASEIELTTDGEQNFQPVWSPDGQRIAYHSKNRGGIWDIPATGGKARQLTDFGSRPAWSPDGTLIAFQSNALTDLGIGARNALPPSTLWIIPAQGGEPKQVTQPGNPIGGHGCPSWSPDGKRLVFEADQYDGGSVWSISVNGDDLKRISPGRGYDPIYAPDGKTIYFTLGGLWGIHIEPKSGEPIGSPTPIERAPSTELRYPSICADGKKIVYSVLSQNSNILSLPLSIDRRQATVYPLTQDMNTRNSCPVFSPDGRKIAYDSGRTGAGVDSWIMNADGSGRTQLTIHPTSPDVDHHPFVDHLPSWFPEMNEVAFLSIRDGRPKIRAVTIASGREREILDLGPDLDYFRLSPDGNQVAFTKKQDGVINIWTTPVAGGEVKQLTFDQEMAGFPVWSPDGKWLAFEMKRGDDTHIAIIPSSGGTPTQLSFDPGQSWLHSWTPDGDKIVFAGFRNGYWNVWWVSRSTKEQKQLTDYKKLNAFVRYPAWSPLGNQIAYEYTETIGNIWVMQFK